MSSHSGYTFCSGQACPRLAPVQGWGKGWRSASSPPSCWELRSWWHPAAVVQQADSSSLVSSSSCVMLVYLGESPTVPENHLPENPWSQGTACASSVGMLHTPLQSSRSLQPSQSSLGVSSLLCPQPPRKAVSGSSCPTSPLPMGLSAHACAWFALIGAGWQPSPRQWHLYCAVREAGHHWGFVRTSRHPFTLSAEFEDTHVKLS